MEQDLSISSTWMTLEAKAKVSGRKASLTSQISIWQILSYSVENTRLLITE